MSLRQRLREATASAHEALERDLDWQAHVATRDGYRRLLSCFHGFHAVYEPAIGLGLCDERFFAPRRRLTRLEADLACLGLDAAAIAALPAPVPPALAGPAEAMGALYVLEGSTLGGQVIARRIFRLHGLDGVGGCAYYRAHGRAAAPMWAEFCARLETVTATSKAQASALSAGIATFEAMRLWLVRSARPSTEAA